ncbi:MAG: MlaC/ttg2D family ABC transporter substrate-binding protein [Gammaproteobacteria bacterium]
MNIGAGFMHALFREIGASRISVALTCLSMLVNAAAADEHPAQKLVRETAGLVTSRLIAEPALKKDPERLQALVDDVVLPHFDFTRMSKRVLARNWRKASAGEQQSFTAAFKALLVRTYSTALSEYSNQEIKFLPVRDRPEKKRATVRTLIGRPGAQPIPIDYAMFEAPDGWKVYDVTVSEVSLVINYRSSFAAEIRKSGMAGLIKRLTERGDG